MTFKTEINTPWVDGGVGTKERFHAKLRDDFPGVNYSDVTHQSVATLTPSPNVYCVLVNGVEGATLDLIHTHADYFVMWRREESDPFVSDEDIAMTVSDWALYRAYLEHCGYSQAELDAGMGTVLNNRTNVQISDDSVSMFRLRPKGSELDYHLFSGPLDEVPGAEAAYSITRRLTSVSWGTVDGVLDPMARLIRSSDSAQMTFSYGSNNELDTAAIVTFLGGASGDFVKIYDQTGNGFHRDQATATKQPLYVASGIGSKPSVDFDRLASQHLGGVSTSISIPFTLYTVFRSEVSFGSEVLVGSHSAARMLFTFLDSDRLQVRPVDVITNFNISALSLGTDYVSVLKRDASNNLLFFANGTNTTVGSPSSSEATGIGDIGSRQGGGIHYDGLFSELLFYKVDHSTADQGTIEDNTGAFYGIPIIARSGIGFMKIETDFNVT